MTYPHPMDDKTGFEVPRCEHCGGDESKCDFNFSTDRCSEMERQFDDDGRLDEKTSGELVRGTDSPLRPSLTSPVDGVAS